MEATQSTNSESTRPANSVALHRLLKLLRWIPQGNWTTAGELRQKLQEEGELKVPSIRTLQRDLSLLVDEFGVEFEDDGNTRMYRWASGFQAWTQPNLGEQESLLLSLSQQHLGNILPANMHTLFDKQFVRAEKILTQSGAGSPYRQWSDKVRIVQGLQPLLPPELADGVFDQVTRALYGNNWLTVTYKNHQGKISEGKRIMPLGLVQQEQRLYLVCRFEGYSSDRTLALPRIQTAKISTIRFERPDDFDLAELEKKGRFAVSKGQKIQLSFSITKDSGTHLLESRLAEDQVAEEIEGGYRITATVVDSLLLKRWLNSFAENVWDVEKTEAKVNN